MGLSTALFHAGRASHLLSTVMHSCAVGCLTLAELRAGIPEHWQEFNRDESDINEGLYAREAWFADGWIRPGASVLVSGCGSGRELFALIGRGCHVTGVDPARHALDTARRLAAQRGLEATLIDGFIEDAPAPGPFDAAVFANNSYGLIPERMRRMRTLRGVASLLNPGGAIYVDYQVLARPRPIVIRAARLAGRIARSDWRLEPGDLVGWCLRDGRPYYSYGHAFTAEEIEQEAAAAGLRIVATRDSPEYPAFVLQR
jgi:SAM-dependent methyltransferase